jgi:hypothetical protein
MILFQHSADPRWGEVVEEVGFVVRHAHQEVNPEGEVGRRPYGTDAIGLPFLCGTISAPLKEPAKAQGTWVRRPTSPRERRRFRDGASQNAGFRPTFPTVSDRMTFFQ